MVEIGLCNLRDICDNPDLIQGIVDYISDTFNKFVNWLVNHVCDTILSKISPVVEEIWNGIAGWTNGLMSLISQLTWDAEHLTISGSKASDMIADAIVSSAIFTEVLVIAIAIYAVMLVMTPIIAPYSFVLSEIAPLLIIAILMADSGIVGGSGSSEVALGSDIINEICDILGSGLIDFETTMFGIIFGVVDSILTLGTCAENFGVRTFFEFSLSIIGAILSLLPLFQIGEETTLASVVICCIGLVFTGAGFLLIWNDNSVLKEICRGWDALSTLISALDIGVSAISLVSTCVKYQQGSN
jgi:hypothetical protein